MIRAKRSFAYFHAVQADSLTIIPHPHAFVKRFLKSFFNFFAVFFAGLLAVSLHIIALLFLFVNRFFQSFFDLEIQASLYKSRGLVLYIFTNARAPEHSITTVFLLFAYIYLPSASYFPYASKILQNSSQTPLQSHNSMVYCKWSRSRNGRCVG